MKKTNDLTETELLQLREKFKEKHKRSLLIQSRLNLSRFYNFFTFKSCQSLPELK